MNSTQQDSSVQSANRDASTVTASGRSISKVIEGVSVESPVNHVDHRGRVFEVFSGLNDHWKEPLVYCYTFTVRPNQVKGWGLHEHKDDRYTLISGELLTVLYDARPESPTYRLVQKVLLSPEGARKLLIPTGVWHMNICLGSQEAFLINHPTKVYEHAAPDRLLLPWNTNEIPVDISDFFPKQNMP